MSAELQKRIVRLERNNRRNKLNHLKSRKAVAAKVGDGFDDVAHIAEGRIKQQENEIMFLQIQLDTLNGKADDTMSENQLLVKIKK